MSITAKGNQIENDNINQWIRNVKDEIFDDDKAIQKPSVAKIVFENTFRPIKWGDNDEDLPYKWFDDANYELTDGEAYWNSTKYAIDDLGDDNKSYMEAGCIATGEEMEQSPAMDTDPVLNVLKNTLLGNRKVKWKSSLDTISEQRINKRANDDHVQVRENDVGISRKSRKTYMGQLRKMAVQKHLAKIPSATGIYRNVIKMQNDGGANRSVTNQRQNLIHFESIPPYPICGVKDGEPALHCTGKGYLPWTDDYGNLLIVPCYYSSDVADTIISPNDIVHQNLERLNEWNFRANHDSELGCLTFIGRDGSTHYKFSAYKENNLWFHYNVVLNKDDFFDLNQSTKAIANRLTDGAAYELWHHRLGHPGERIMNIIHEKVDGIPKLRKNQFYHCAACLAKNIRKLHIGEKKSLVKTPKNTTSQNCAPGEHLHMDFGFVRGSDWKKKDSDGKLVTSIDNHRAYLLIIDRATRYIWIFLTKSKHPPISQVEGFLKRFKGLHRNATITTDNGGDLSKSIKFRKVIKDADYTLNTTGAHASAQNGLAERPNQDLAKMMRALLYSADLGSEYWSYALRHSVYLKNRLPHSALQFTTPFEKLNGHKPNLSKLKVFGSRVSVHNGTRGAKLDDISSVGTFLSYKNTDKIIYVRDRKSGEEKVATHAVFDEAYMAERIKSIPPMASALQQAGYRQLPDAELGNKAVKIKENHLNITLLSKEATLPKRGSATAAGIDMYSSENVCIPPKEQHLISTGIAMEIPQHHFGKLEIRSGLALKHKLDVVAGIIDNDYRGEVKIILRNNGENEFKIQVGDRIAQMLILPQPSFEIHDTPELKTTTNRGAGGFGSTGITTITPSSTHNNATKSSSQESLLSPQSKNAPHLIPNDTVNIEYAPNASSPRIPTDNGPHLIHTLDADGDYYPTCNVNLSTDPYKDCIGIKMETYGDHPTRGLSLQNSTTHLETIDITECLTSTPAGRIKNWRSRLRNNRLLKLNGITITSIEDVKSFFRSLDKSIKEVILTIGQLEKTAMHLDDGLPMVYFNQLSTISQHLRNIKYDQNASITPHDVNRNDDIKAPILINMMKAYLQHGTVQAAKAAIPQAILPKSKRRKDKLTRCKLKKMDNWDSWKKSE